MQQARRPRRSIKNPSMSESAFLQLQQEMNQAVAKLKEVQNSELRRDLLLELKLLLLEFDLYPRLATITSGGCFPPARTSRPPSFDLTLPRDGISVQPHTPKSK
jgi:hypothetical protein